jgi:O-antigen/teichoic acid export membrane protein
LTDTAFAPKLRRLGSETLIYGLSTVVGKFLNYLLQPYYAHQLALSDNGIQSVVYGYIPFVWAVLFLGMDVAYMRNVSDGEAASLEHRQRMFTMSMGTVVLVGGGVTLAVQAAAPVLAPLARVDVLALRYLVAIAFADALLIVPFAHLRMVHQALRYAVLKLAAIVITVALNIVLIGVLHYGVAAVFFANLVSDLLILLLLAGEIVRLFRPSLFSTAAWKPLWAYALPIIPGTVAVAVVENFDLIRLNFLPERVAQALYHLTSKDLVGVYNFNYKLGVAMLLVVQMFRLAWVPFSLQHAREPGAPRLYSRVLTALMLICAAAFLGIALLLPAFVELPFVQSYIKPAYWIGMPIVPVILLGYVFNGMYAVVTAGLYIERRTDVLPWIAGTGSILNIALCIVAAPRWGLVGVAWATPAAYGLMALVGAWQANRFYPVPFEWGRLAALGLLTAALFLLDRWFVSLGVVPLSAAGLGLKAALLLALPGVLLVAGFFRHGEMRALRSILLRS